MVSPAKMTSPALGLSVLVIRLNRVDLPAPFGPMTARISPGSTVMSTWSTATSAPKRRTSPLHSSSGIGRLLAGGRIRRLGGFLGSGSVRMPQMPCGANITKAMKIDAEDQRPEVGDLRQLDARGRRRTRPPMIGPISVPAPPTTTMISTRPEVSQKNSSGDAKPAKPHRARPRARRSHRPGPRSRSCRRACCSRARWSWPRSRGCRRAPRRTASARSRGTSR